MLFGKEGDVDVIHTWPFLLKPVKKIKYLMANVLLSPQRLLAMTTIVPAFQLSALVASV